MKVQESHQVSTKEIDVIDGTFSVSEATSILNGILDVKINYHKLQMMSRKEGDNNDVCEYDTTRLNALMTEKELTRVFLKELRVRMS